MGAPVCGSTPALPYGLGGCDPIHARLEKPYGPLPWYYEDPVMSLAAAILFGVPPVAFAAFAFWLGQ